MRRIALEQRVSLPVAGGYGRMNGAWRKTTLGDLLSFSNGISSPERSDELPHPVYGSDGIIGFSDETNSSPNAIVIGRVASYCGSLHFSQMHCWVTDNAIRAEATDGNDAKFLFHLLHTLHLNDWRTSSGQPLLNQTTLSSIPTTVPPLPTQCAIAHILGTLDDKIDLNRHMNETLEAMARAKLQGRDPYLPLELWSLFPDRLADSELGEVPEGWEVRALGDCYDLTMGQSPPGDTYNDDSDGMPFFQGNSDFGCRYPSNRKFCTAPMRLAAADDTLVSVRAPVGAINMAWEQCCIGRGVAALRHKSGSSSFTYYSAWALQPEIQQYEQTGTVFGAITKSNSRVCK